MTLKRRKAIAVVLVFVILLTSFCWTAETADAATGNDIANLAIQIANGPKIPYVSGGRSLRGFDCCGFVWYVCNQLGVNVGTGNQRSQINYGAAVDYSLLKSNGNVSALQPGDLVFFDYTGGGSDHVGIYVGSGQMAHTSSSRSDVIIVSLSGQCGYGPWYSVVCGVRRVANGGSAAGCSHTYWKGSESAHPHKEFYKCSKCGYYYYTGVNFAGQISSCSTCQSMKPAVCTHTYVTESESLHPHKEYKRCTKCGYTYYTGVDFAGKINSCGTCKAMMTVCQHENGWINTEWDVHPHRKYKLCSDCGYKEYTGETVKNSSCSQCNENKSFYLTIDSNGGKIDKGNYSYSYTTGQFIDLSQISVSRIGYKFTGWRLKLSDENKWCTNQSDSSGGYYFSTLQEMSEKGYSYRRIGSSTKIDFSRGAWSGEKTDNKLTLVAMWEEDPSAEIECKHNYKISYGIPHPHKEYKMCFLCGDVQYTGKTGTSGDCDKCLEEESLVKAVQISGKAYDGYIKINWPDQEAIAEYVIYRSTDGKNYEEYGDTFGISYVDKNVKSGSTYYYYVIVKGEINTSEKSNIFKVELSSQSKAEKIRTGIENTQIKNLKAKKTGSKVKLTWKKSLSKYKVDGYFVLRSTKKNATYKKIKETTVRSCTVVKPKKGKTYYYMVFGYRIVDGEMINTIPARIAVKG